MEEEVKRDRSVFVPFLVGSVVGAGIALLLAPKSGKEIRKQMADIASDAKNTVSSAYTKGRELYDEGKTAVSSAIEAGKAAYVQEKEKHLQAA